VLVAPLGLHIPVSVTCVELPPLVDRLLALLLPKLNLLPRFDSVLHSKLFRRFLSRSQKMLKPTIIKAATTKPTDIPIIVDFGILLRDCRDAEPRSPVLGVCEAIGMNVSVVDWAPAVDDGVCPLAAVYVAVEDSVYVVDDADSRSMESQMT